jgi:hypothetical protein
VEINHNLPLPYFLVQSRVQSRVQWRESRVWRAESGACCGVTHCVMEWSPCIPSEELH